MSSKYGFETEDERKRKAQTENEAQQARYQKLKEWQRARTKVVVARIDAVVRDVLRAGRDQ